MQHFSEGLLGKGAVIVPTVGEIIAPFDGVVVTLFPTKHAIGLLSSQGAELLIHVGIDTVQLDGQFLKVLSNKVRLSNKVKDCYLLI